MWGCVCGVSGVCDLWRFEWCVRRCLCGVSCEGVGGVCVCARDLGVGPLSTRTGGDTTPPSLIYKCLVWISLTTTRGPSSPCALDSPTFPTRVQSPRPVRRVSCCPTGSTPAFLPPFLHPLSSPALRDHAHSSTLDDTSSYREADSKHRGLVTVLRRSNPRYEGPASTPLSLTPLSRVLRRDQRRIRRTPPLVLGSRRRALTV